MTPDCDPGFREDPHSPRMKLRQNGTVSHLINLIAPAVSGGAHFNLIAAKPRFIKARSDFILRSSCLTGRAESFSMTIRATVPYPFGPDPACRP